MCGYAPADIAAAKAASAGRGHGRPTRPPDATDNNAAQLLARATAQHLDPRRDDRAAIGHFLAMMRDRAEALGLGPLTFDRAYSSGVMSAAQVAILLKHIAAHCPATLAAMASAGRDIVVATASGEARRYHVASTVRARDRGAPQHAPHRALPRHRQDRPGGRLSGRTQSALVPCYISALASAMALVSVVFLACKLFVISSRRALTAPPVSPISISLLRPLGGGDPAPFHAHAAQMALAADQ